MRKKILISVLLVSIVSLGSAQQVDITNADSIYTDTQLTAELTGMPSDTQLTLESLGTDTTEITTFTTTSTGSATISFRHNPFPDGTALVSDGWTYRLRDQSGSFNYEFELQHNNMLQVLDTFNDGTVNSNLFDEINEVNEANGELEAPLTGSGSNGVVVLENVNRNEVFKVEITQVSSDGNSAFVFAKPDVSPGQGGINVEKYNFPDDATGTYTMYWNTDAEEYTIERNGNIVQTYSNSTAPFTPKIENNQGSNEDLRLTSLSYVPKTTEEQFQKPNQYFTGDDSNFKQFLTNQGTNTGLEFSTDGVNWSATLPDSGDTLYYRNTGSAELGSVAVDTSSAFQGNLTFNPIRPNNNTAFTVQENNSLNRDFVYEILYQREDCSDFAGLFSSFQLFNTSSGNQITSTTYPSLELESTECTFLKEFNDQETLPAGEYRWRVSFQDNNIGVSKVWNQYFTIQEPDQLPVTFNLTDPKDGESVTLDNGSTTFSYDVDASKNGEVNLWIPQESSDPVFTENIDAGEYSTSVVLDLAADQNYDWYLTFTNSTTYQSSTNSFSTNTVSDGGDNGGDSGGDNGGDTNQSISDFTSNGSVDLPGLYYFIVESKLNITGDAADYLAGGIISVGLGALLASVGGAALGGVGIILGMLLAALVGLVPGWIVFIFTIVSGWILAKVGVFGVD